MADRRLAGALAAITSLATASCRASEADVGHGLVPPAAWQQLPELAAAAADALAASGAGVAGRAAWGDPARGCYAAWLELRGGQGGAEAIAARLLDGVTAEPALSGIAVREVVAPAAGTTTGVLAFAFTRVPYEGRVRAAIGPGGHIGALACFWNEREPIACEGGCVQLIGSMR
jgi:hypothetical protein